MIILFNSETFILSIYDEYGVEYFHISQSEDIYLKTKGKELNIITNTQQLTSDQLFNYLNSIPEETIPPINLELLTKLNNITKVSRPRNNKIRNESEVEHGVGRIVEETYDDTLCLFNQTNNILKINDPKITIKSKTYVDLDTFLKQYNLGSVEESPYISRYIAQKKLVVMEKSKVKAILNKEIDKIQKVSIKSESEIDKILERGEKERGGDSGGLAGTRGIVTDEARRIAEKYSSTKGSTYEHNINDDE